MLSGEEWFRVENESLLTTTQKVVQRLHCTNTKRQRSFHDGLGLISGQERWIFLPSDCQISQLGCQCQPSWVPSSSSPSTCPWHPRGSHFPAGQCSSTHSICGYGYFWEMQHPGGWLATLFPRPQLHWACLCTARMQASEEITDIRNRNRILHKVQARLDEVLPKIWEEIPDAYFQKL